MWPAAVRCPSRPLEARNPAAGWEASTVTSQIQAGQADLEWVASGTLRMAAEEAEDGMAAAVAGHIAEAQAVRAIAIRPSVWDPFLVLLVLLATAMSQ